MKQKKKTLEKNKKIVHNYHNLLIKTIKEKLTFLFEFFNKLCCLKDSLKVKKT